MNTGNINHSPEILNSWKEIAAYLDRGVRTVQRWEVELGMPVRRPRGRGRSAVIALRADLDGWILRCPVEKLEQSAQARVVTMPKGRGEIILASQALRSNVSSSRLEVKKAINRLMETLGKMVQTPPSAA